MSYSLNVLILAKFEVGEIDGETPESLWSNAVDLSKEGGNKETADIFETAMENIFKVGSTIIDAILDGKL